MPIDAAADATLMMLPPCRHDLPRHFFRCRLSLFRFSLRHFTLLLILLLLSFRFSLFSFFRLFSLISLSPIFFYAMLQMLLMPC